LLLWGCVTPHALPGASQALVARWAVPEEVCGWGGQALLPGAQTELQAGRQAAQTAEQAI